MFDIFLLFSVVVVFVLKGPEKILNIGKLVPIVEESSESLMMGRVGTLYPLTSHLSIHPFNEFCPLANM